MLKNWIEPLPTLPVYVSLICVSFLLYKKKMIMEGSVSCRNIPFLGEHISFLFSASGCCILRRPSCNSVAWTCFLS